ncbi:competence type IV pilus major pilin ComGC [Bhargavaea ginsengi]|uniref:competence type IV pilus major pilin ComGC n=1 Tax=Bhargavaea ginsengi TaxID=426757 RepID=UPI001FDFB1A3|nr:competence type IV pilus major pilin ComGC [Bhargavaea ginsengi]MCM3088888.1 prepilin-type N-terminal cleavage/methylation domain-containing protein [Bhargavaea ginsengi]
MKKLINQSGFTLIEMMIVLLVISVLILLAIPNVTKRAAEIDETGCNALVKMVEGQVQAYKIENKQNPESEADLKPDYLEDGDLSCSDGRTIVVNNGVVTATAP